MEIEALEVEGATILYLGGDLDAASCDHVRGVVAELFASGRRCVVLDLRAVAHMYTAGISTLTDLRAIALTHGGRLLFCGARPFIRELLHLTRSHYALEMHSDLDSALDDLACQAS